MTIIYIDADACPVREEVYRVAERTGVTVEMVHNGSRPIRPPNLPHVHVTIVGEGADKADDWIAEHIGGRDICVTGDIPLAKRCLEAGARALSHNGHVWTADNIGSALAGRELSRHMRELGVSTGGNAAMTKADRSRFLNALDTVITAAKRDAV